MFLGERVSLWVSVGVCGSACMFMGERVCL